MEKKGNKCSSIFHWKEQEGKKSICSVSLQGVESEDADAAPCALLEAHTVGQKLSFFPVKQRRKNFDGSCDRGMTPRGYRDHWEWQYEDRVSRKQEESEQRVLGGGGVAERGGRVRGGYRYKLATPVLYWAKKNEPHDLLWTEFTLRVRTHARAHTNTYLDVVFFLVFFSVLWRFLQLQLGIRGKNNYQEDSEGSNAT